MADQRERVVKIIFSALASLNEERESSRQIAIHLTTPLFGGSSALDSLSLVSVIVDVETGVSEVFGKIIALTDDSALNQHISPFTSVAALADYTVELLSSDAAAA
jgi:acyl carrier protein